MSNESYADRRYLMGEIEKAKAECELRIAEAVASEREACAKLVEEWPGISNNLTSIAIAIRARGELGSRSMNGDPATNRSGNTSKIP